MIPKITKRGGSFKGAFAYYLHDKKAKTQNRIGWAEMLNIPSSIQAHEAWRVMAYTALNAARLKQASGRSRKGASMKKPVFAFSLSWHPEQSPSKKHMMQTAEEAIHTLGLEEHECVVVCHTDEPHPHLHIIANTVHPLTGMVNALRNSKRRLQHFASNYERSTKVYCHGREKQRRQSSRKMSAQSDVFTLAIRAYKSAVDETDFVSRLHELGLTLARGRKRLVLVDAEGQAHALMRALSGIATPAFRNRFPFLGDLELPDADAILKAHSTVLPCAERKAKPSFVYHSESRKRAQARLKRRLDRDATAAFAATLD